MSMPVSAVRTLSAEAVSALQGGRIDDLIAAHRRIFGGWSMEGGDGSGDGGSGADSGDAATGYPANTPVEQMQPAQQAAYWQAQSKKHEGRANANYKTLRDLGITDDATAQSVREKLDRHDALENELSSEAEKSARKAGREAAAAADAKYLPLLVQAEFKTAAVGRIVGADGKLDSDRLGQILEPLDLSKFLTASGEVDATRVAAYIEQVAPAKGTGRQVAPTVFGLGPNPPVVAKPGDQGRAMAAKRFGTAQTT